MSYQQQDSKEKGANQWLELWQKKGLWQAKDNQPQKEYVLVEFPYPSGSGLHIGHAFSFTGADVYARFRRMQGKNVLFPMGWDAFGLPTENYAIKNKKSPQEVTEKNTKEFKRQMNELGFSFDWEREVNTTDPQYYKWTQWIFIQLFKKGLAYKESRPINWCPSCKIGLANEEVIEGKCERCGAVTSQKKMNQWIVKITQYADRLIEGLTKTDFIEKVKTAQINWIGKSQGAQVVFKIKNQDQELKVFTTRPDTLWGATFMVISPEHEIIKDILKKSSKEKQKEIKDYLNQTKKKSDLERTELAREKTGVFTQWQAINPVNNQAIPVWISDFVLASYGTGAIMAVPAHDQRDWEFAQKFDLPIIPVIQPPQDWDFNQKAYPEVEQGLLINSPPINGLTPAQALPQMIEWLKEKKIGQPAENYHLRDWIFSRQHYWGEPIPMVYCPRCGWQPVKEEDLPVELPRVKNYQPTQTGESPLSKITDWVKTTCPVCQGEAERETDTMPNWAGSDWYFLRYLDPQNQSSLADKKKLEDWLPVDIYIGGDEHNTLHLLYSRFIYQFLWDLGVVPQKYPEPYQKRISHGVILGPDNQRMSKSRGNVIIPEQILKKYKKYGADILRIYLMFMGPFEGTMAWNDSALTGVKKFLNKIEDFLDLQIKNKNFLSLEKENPLIHQTIKKVSHDIEKLRFNTAIACLMEFLNTAREQENPLTKKEWEKFLILLSPFAPFFAEEQWHKIYPEKENQSIFAKAWPDFDLNLAQKQEIELVIQINGKVRDKILMAPKVSESVVQKMVLAREKIKTYLKGKKIKKIIFVPDKLINLVVE